MVCAGAFFARAQSPAPPQQSAGLESDWDIAAVLREVSAHAARLLPLLDRADAGEWAAKGAPAAYAAQLQSSKEQAQALADEAAAARETRQEILKIPRDPGVYQLEDGKLRVFEAAECTVHNSKGRNVLKTLIPLVNGKATLDTPGEHSQNVVKDSSPEFFVQLSEFESFGMIKLTPAKGQRNVEQISVLPVAKEMEETRTPVETFTKQLSDNGLYKIWPQDPLPQGEYAIVEYTEGKVNIQVWDFRIE